MAAIPPLPGAHLLAVGVILHVESRLSPMEKQSAPNHTIGEIRTYNLPVNLNISASRHPERPPLGSRCPDRGESATCRQSKRTACAAEGNHRSESADHVK